MIEKQILEKEKKMFQNNKEFWHSIIFLLEIAHSTPGLNLLLVATAMVLLGLPDLGQTYEKRHKMLTYHQPPLVALYFLTKCSS